MSFDTKMIADALGGIFIDVPKPIALHEPEFSESARRYVLDCIDAGWVSTSGAYVDRFARDLSGYTGLHAVPVVNGTAALHLSLYIAGVRHGEEVLTPSLTFVATANAVSYLGATPHFIDCREGGFSLDIEKLDAYLADNFIQMEDGLVNKNTQKLSRALIVTHVFGHIEDIEMLSGLCVRYNLKLIEDAAEALGSFYEEKHAGHFGALSALSFNGNKIVTTGGGGAVLTADEGLADKLRHLSTTAKAQDPYSPVHDEIAFNYRMPNINAALGCSQLEDLGDFLVRKRSLAENYRALFQHIDGVTFLDEPKVGHSNFWLNTIMLPSENARNAMIDELSNLGLMARGIWRPLHLLPMYKNSPRMDCSNAEDSAVRSLNIPSSPFLGNAVCSS